MKRTLDGTDIVWDDEQLRSMQDENAQPFMSHCDLVHPRSSRCASSLILGSKDVSKTAA